MLNPKASPLVFPKLLLTGAAGQLGRELRPRLKAYCDVLRVSDQNARQPHIDRHDKSALFQGGAFVKMAPHGE